MEVQIFRVYFIKFRVEAMKDRKRENNGTRAWVIEFDGKRYIQSRCRMVYSSAILKGFHVAYVLSWLMDVQIVNGFEVMKNYYYLYILCDWYQLEVYSVSRNHVFFMPFKVAFLLESILILLLYKYPFVWSLKSTHQVERI